MRQSLLFVLIALLGISFSFGQATIQSPTSGTSRLNAKVFKMGRTAASASAANNFDPALAPFYHGVASGDPMSNKVIIWTRVTPETSNDTSFEVIWRMATDTAMTNVVAQGTFTTSFERDYTVKIDADGLASNTTYYYEFEALNKRSLRGRTKTAPNTNEENHLRFAVVSCSNYEAGYFNAYGNISRRNDLAGVIHLGDYIYEYPANVYGDTSLLDRRHDTLETVDLGQYRSRYSLYRLDPDLRAVHQQHPFINVWDDHETANDAWKGGAENHTDSTEGDWNQRIIEARQAYYEWIPIRENAVDSNIIYRELPYGDLLDIFMVDTRIIGRDSQINDVLNPALYDPSRTLLGDSQRQWLLDKLSNSTAKWKLIGNQVIFSQLNVGWAAVPPQTATDVENIFLDIWDGYPAERLKIINHIETDSIDNVVFVTGDFHSTFAFDIADTVTNDAAFYAPVPNYVDSTGEGSVAVKFTTPSISAANFDENIDPITSAGLEFQFNNPFPAPLPPNNPNPHMKNVDLDRHGYTLVDIRDDSVQANWYYVGALNVPDSSDNFGSAYYTKTGENRLQPAMGESPIKTEQDTVAPATVRTTPNVKVEAPITFAVMGIYPNPAGDRFVVQYALSEVSDMELNLRDLQGRLIKNMLNETQAPGVYELLVNTSELASGIYILEGGNGNNRIAKRVVIK
ncbi:MAG: alkaline phosphatase D family protein [Bacteroidia bacterium]|nr:alkaline phosphatase D family protein [Bacteroidia bacterium]